MNPVIFHIDVNSAYLSWEAARRVAGGQPDIRLIPAAVGGDRQKRTGVILAKSQSAKECGVQTGEPVGMALKKCPALILVKPDFQLYVSCSHQFVSFCRQYAPVVEQVSIDECFLDMSGTAGIYGDPLKMAQRIRKKIKADLGFTVNIGIGPNKLLAKMASGLRKPDQVHTIFAAEIPSKLWPLPVERLYSVGQATAKRLRAVSINTISDLAATDPESLMNLLGQKSGLQLHRYANGLDDSPVSPESEQAKGYSNSITLEQDVTTAQEALKIILALSDSVAARMRADEARAFCVAVTIRGPDFTNHSRQRKLRESTNITSEIYSVARSLFGELWDQKTPLRLLGVALTNLTRERLRQQSLFDNQKKERDSKLDQTIDQLRSQFGAETIVRAAVLDLDRKVGKKHKAQLEQREDNPLE